MPETCKTRLLFRIFGNSRGNSAIHATQNIDDDDGHAWESDTMNKTVNDMNSFSDKFSTSEPQNNDPHNFVLGTNDQPITSTLTENEQ